MVANVKNVEYKITQHIEEYPNDANQIEIRQEGKSTDNRSQLDYEYELDDCCFAGAIPEGKYKANYLLNSSDNFIEKIDFNCSFNYDQISNLKFTAVII